MFKCIFFTEAIIFMLTLKEYEVSGYSNFRASKFTVLGRVQRLLLVFSQYVQTFLECNDIMIQN